MPFVRKAVERRSHQLLLREFRDRLEPRTTYCNIIGMGQAMRNDYEVIESISDFDPNVLIVGESGTGKEMIANAVHAGSRRAKHLFVKINCAALPK